MAVVADLATLKSWLGAVGSADDANLQVALDQAISSVTFDVKAEYLAEDEVQGAMLDTAMSAGGSGAAHLRVSPGSATSASCVSPPSIPTFAASCAPTATSPRPVSPDVVAVGGADHGRRRHHVPAVLPGPA